MILESCFANLISPLRKLSLVFMLLIVNQSVNAEEFTLIPLRPSTRTHYIEDSFYIESNSTNRREIIRIECDSISKRMYILLGTQNNSWRGSYSQHQVSNCHDHAANLVNQTFPFFTENKGESEAYTISKIRSLNDFEKFDQQSIFKLNTIFRESFNVTNAENGNLSFQWGKKTKKVYVFVHGLGLSEGYFYSTAFKVFQAGHNVIVGKLPGHESFENLRSTGLNASWLLYSESLAQIARHYGEEVIFVGQSLGGQLSIRAAEMGLVDGLILLQPLVGLSVFNKSLIQIGKTINFDDFLQSFAAAAKYADSLTQIPYRKIPAKTKVVVFLSKHDIAVDNEQTSQWIDFYAPQSKKIESEKFNSFEGHMQIPKNILDVLN